jgi:YbbR domain-containing protein
MKGSDFLRRITKDMPLKIIALLLAIILWLYVTGIKNSERIIDVPLEITNLPSNTMIVSPVPQKITMKVRGPRNILFRLSSTDLKYTIDATGMQIGTNVFNFTGDQLELPTGVQTIWISPSTLTIIVNETIRKKLTVAPKFEGSPGKGYQVTDYNFTPSEIEIEGAKDSLKGIEKIYTKPIDISGEIVSLKNISIPLDTAQINYKYIDTDAVNANIFIAPIYISKVLNSVQITVKGGQSEFKVSPETVDVQISGPENVLEAFPLNEIEVYINIENMAPGHYTIKPNVEVPDNIHVEAVKPESVDLIIKKEKR